MICLKSSREIELMRVSGNITAEVLSRVTKIAEPGITTRKLDDYAESLLKEYDAVPAFKGYRGYPGCLCISVNEQVVHGIPGDRKLIDGDIVSIDFGVIKNGFYGDMAVTLEIGKVSPLKKMLVETTKVALEKGIEQAVAGNYLGDISNAIEQYATDNGFSIVRDYVGHGIGQEMHEDPQIPNFGEPKTGPRLKEGMVFAIEPMVNAGTYSVKTLKDGWTVVTCDGKPSAHWEHTVAITANGPEVLTCRKKI